MLAKTPHLSVELASRASKKREPSNRTLKGAVAHRFSDLLQNINL